MSESITKIFVKQSSKNLTKYARTERSQQSLKINNVGGNVKIGTVDLSDTQTLSITSIHNYQLTGENAAEIAKNTAAELKKQQNSPIAQVDHSSLYDTIRTTISANLNIENIRVDITKQLEKQVFDIENVKGNVIVGSLTMKEQSTIVAKAFETSIEATKLSEKILSKLKIKDTQISTGPIGTISQQLGISYRTTVIAIAVVVAGCVLFLGIFLVYLLFGGSDETNMIYTRPPLT